MARDGGLGGVGGLNGGPRQDGWALDPNVFTPSNVWGLWITVIAGVCSNLGVQLQKHAHGSRQVKENTQQPYFIDKQWMVGMILVILGSIGDFEALSFATQSMVATVGGGTTVITNVLFSTVWHGEHFTLRDAYGTFCILLGVILIAMCSPQDEQYNVEQLMATFQRPGVLIYLCVLLTFMGVVFLLLKDDQLLHQYSLSSTFSSRTSARVRRFLQMDASNPSFIQPMLYAMISGIMGSLSMLLGKCASEMVKTTLIHGHNQFHHPMTFVFFGGMAGTIALQIHWFNHAIMHGDISIVFPVFQVFWISFGVVGGMVLYGDLARLEFFQAMSFLLAFSCILVGVYNLAQHVHVEKNIDSQGVSSVNDLDSNLKLVPHEAYQTLLESHDHNDGSALVLESQNTYRPPALLRTL